MSEMSAAPSRILGSGPMADAIRAYDWNASPLGPVSRWSEALVTTTNLVLSLRYPAMILWGPQMVMLYNDSFVAFLTNRHPGALGQRGREFWTDVWPVVGEQMEAVFREGKQFEFQRALIPILNNGELVDRYFDYTYSPIYDTDGSIGGLLDLCQDVTAIVVAEQERAAAQKAVATERAHLLNMLQQAPFFFALLEGPSHVITMANPLYMKLVGYRDILGKSVAEALPEVVEQGYIGMLDGVYATGEPLVLQSALVEIVHMEGRAPEPRFVNFTYQPLRDPDDGTAGVIVLGVDITESKQAEQALVRNEKLAAVGRLASSIAHEINNPMEAVTNLLYLAASTEDVAEIQKYIEMAEREVRRMSAITHQTLSFHKQSTEPREVTSLDLLSGVLHVYQSRLLNVGIDAHQRERATNAVVCFDGEIRQVLNNLVANAIDSMQGVKGARLLVRSRDVTHARTGERGIALTIADTGSGMSVETLKRVFEPFYTTKGLGGTGLGLWLSRDIVARHRGELRVRSSQGPAHHGTVFTLFLPLDGVSHLEES